MTVIKGRLMAAVPMGSTFTLIVETENDVKQIAVKTEDFKEFMHKYRIVAGENVEYDTETKTLKVVE